MKKDFPVHNLGKSMFLILMGEMPTRTVLEESRHGDQPRTICYFPREPKTLRLERVFKRLMESTLDVVRSDNRAPEPDELMDKANALWDEYEATAPQGTSGEVA